MISAAHTNNIKIASPLAVQHVPIEKIPRSGFSSLAAYSIRLEAINRLPDIDTALFCCAAYGEERLFHMRPVTEIDTMLDAQLKFILFLIREMLIHFLGRKHGKIIVALDRALPSDPLIAACAEGLRSSIERMRSRYRGKPVDIHIAPISGKRIEQNIDDLINLLKKKGDRQKNIGEKTGLFRSSK